MNTIYENGDYLAKHPDWHAGDSATKARWLFELAMHCALSDWAPLGLKVVDVGCGTGGVGVQFAEMLRLRGLEATSVGIDISPQAIEIAKRAWPDVQFLTATVPLESDFDLALFVDVLEHVPKPSETLEQAKSYSKRIAVHLPLEDNLLQRVRPGRKFYTDLYGHLHFYNRRTAHRLLRESGWRVIAWRWTGGVVDRQITAKVTIGTRVRRFLGLISWDMSFRLLGQAAWMAIAERA